MNKCVKFGIAALAIAATIPSFAAEAENEYEAVGWTPIAVGIASPVQLPWGSHQWDIFGLGVNALWTDTPKMYGLGVGGVAMATRDDLKGIQASALCNWATADVYGLRATLGGNITFGKTYGIDAGLFGYRADEFRGLDVEFLGSYQDYMWGCQIAGICNLDMKQSYGATVAIGGNIAPVAYGAQIAGIFNYTAELHGCQIAVVNFARECPWGFQIGLVNIILDNSIKVLPIVNGYF